MNFRHILPTIALLLCVEVVPAHAQRMITAQVGVGAALDKRNDRVAGTHRHIAAAVEVTFPLLPLGVRADGTWIDAGASGGTAVATINGVLTLKLPVVRPYALAGWGQYGVGGSAPHTGANAGAGVRVSLGPLRVFCEARRHWPLARDLVTDGIAF